MHFLKKKFYSFFRFQIFCLMSGISSFLTSFHFCACRRQNQAPPKPMSSRIAPAMKFPFVSR